MAGTAHCQKCAVGLCKRTPSHRKLALGFGQVVSPSGFRLNCHVHWVLVRLPHACTGFRSGCIMIQVSVWFYCEPGLGRVASRTGFQSGFIMHQLSVRFHYALGFGQVASHTRLRSGCIIHQKFGQVALRTGFRSGFIAHRVSARLHCTPDFGHATSRTGVWGGPVGVGLGGSTGSQRLEQ